jgi:hypothetical protein
MPDKERTSSPAHRREHGPRDYKRAYKACESCRKTKARCEVVSDTEPCSRCQRERKTCVFPIERSSKKRKAHQGVEDGQVRPWQVIMIQHQLIFLSKQRSNKDSEEVSERPSSHRRSIPQSPLPRRAPASTSTNNISQGTFSQQQPKTSTAIEDNVQTATSARENAPPLHRLSSSSHLHDEVMHTVVQSSQDALGLLFKAAEQQDTDDSEDQAMISGVGEASPASALTNQPVLPLPVSALSSPSKTIIELWNQHRFVRQGWFSAREAVTYIDL